MVIEYKGHRVLCSSKLPISSDTLLLGSMNEVQTVKDDNKELRDLVASASIFLGLSVFKFKNTQNKTIQSFSLNSPIELEGHLGTDGRFYIVNFSHTFPISLLNTPKIRSSDSNNDRLAHRFRPEVLRESSLCSNAVISYRGIFNLESYKQAENAENRLVTNIMEIIARMSNFDLPETLNHDSVKLVMSYLRRRGVNMRYLGWLWTMTDHKSLSCIFALEMVCRTAKWIIREKLKKIAERHKECLLEVLNNLLSQETSFWEELIRRLVIKYDGSKCKEFKFSAESISKSSLPLVVERLQGMIGFSLAQKASEEFKVSQIPILTNEHIQDIYPLVSSPLLRFIHFPTTFSKLKVKAPFGEGFEKGMYCFEKIRSTQLEKEKRELASSAIFCFQNCINCGNSSLQVVDKMVEAYVVYFNLCMDAIGEKDALDESVITSLHELRDWLKLVWKIHFANDENKKKEACRLYSIVLLILGTVQKTEESFSKAICYFSFYAEHTVKQILLVQADELIESLAKERKMRKMSFQICLFQLNCVSSIVYHNTDNELLVCQARITCRLFNSLESPEEKEIFAENARAACFQYFTEEIGHAFSKYPEHSTYKDLSKLWSDDFNVYKKN